MPRVYVRVGATSCADCLSWGVHRARRCPTCTTWQHTGPRARLECSGCRRLQPTREGFCRSCWQLAWQTRRAHYETHGGRLRSARELLVELIEAGHGRPLAHQLALAVGVTRSRPQRNPRLGHQAGVAMLAAAEPAAAKQNPAARDAAQQRLFDLSRDLTRIPDLPAADPDNPWLAAALRLVARRSQARGWNRDRRDNTVRGLRVVLHGHSAGDTVGYRQIEAALRPRNISTNRVAEVLTELGLLVDDRPSRFEAWLQDKMRGLAPGIATDVRAWLRTLRHGDPRTPALGPAAIYHRHSDLRPALDDWSGRLTHLREVTRGDVIAALEAQRGLQRHQMHLALRSLFSHARRRRTIFHNPTARLRISPRAHRIPQSLPVHELRATYSAATSPAAKVFVVLVAVYGTRPALIRGLRLDDVDLGNRRLRLGGIERPIDPLTHHTLLSWMTHRSHRWPDTANPYLLINQATATGLAAVSESWPRRLLAEADTNLAALRQDRYLDEAMTSGADPLHLAVVFDVDPSTALRYATAARDLLNTAPPSSWPTQPTEPPRHDQRP